MQILKSQTIVQRCKTQKYICYECITKYYNSKQKQQQKNEWIWWYSRWKSFQMVVNIKIIIIIVFRSYRVENGLAYEYHTIIKFRLRSDQIKLRKSFLFFLNCVALLTHSVVKKVDQCNQNSNGKTELRGVNMKNDSKCL